MGKGGGGSPQPSSTTAYQTNLPEYAKPYVMNMLGAAQNQLFETTPGTAGEPGEITGFKPYTPYSTDPTKYFAGPSSLQQSAYGAAGQLQTPSQFGQATGLAGMAGMGQLGTAQQAGIYGGLGTALGAAGAMQAMPAFSAGQQYAQQVTDPRAMAAYMSPYQQAVTDVAKADAIRNAQMIEQGNRLASARQGTYGGARQALASLEREKNLASNLSNIQAQGSQAAYDKAMQAQQFGANLGLQGIQTGLQGVQAGMQGIGQGLQGIGAQQAGYAGAGQAASTLGQLGTQQQGADINTINLQNQLGQQQQAYQQNIINQAIQDYATAQQYPYMQLSTMSNLLRGLPMQSMSTQQYQAQPSTTQQLLGLAGTGASLYGAFKREGGTIKEYAKGGIAEDLRAKLENMADTNPQGLKKLIAQSSSKEVKEMGNEILSGIAMANTGKLGTNLAGGGIIAFDRGGGVYGGPEFGTPEEDEEDNASTWRALKDALLYNSDVAAQKQREKDKANQTADQAGDYDSYTPNTKPVFAANAPAAAPAGAPAGAPAAAPAGGQQAMGIDAILAERRKRLGFGEGPGEKSEALMKALEERQAGMGKEREADRYLRAAEAFSKFGSTAGPMGVAASQALGGFAKGEALARKEEDKMKLEGMKMQADLEKARRAELRGDLDAAEKLYNSAEDRANRIKVAEMGAASAGQATRFEKEAVERIMKEEGVSFAQALERVRGASRSEGLDMQIGKEAYKAAAASVAPGGANSKKYKELMKQDPTGALAKQYVTDLAQEQIRGMKAVLGMGGGNSGASGKVDTSNPLLK